MEWTRLYMPSMCFMSFKTYVKGFSKVKLMTNDLFNVSSQCHLVYSFVHTHQITSSSILFIMSCRPIAHSASVYCLHLPTLNKVTYSLHLKPCECFLDIGDKCMALHCWIQCYTERKVALIWLVWDSALHWLAGEMAEAGGWDSGAGRAKI